MPGIWIIDIRDNSIVLPSGILAVMLFDSMIGDIFVMACFARCKFAPEYMITSMFLLGELGWVPILLIQKKLGLLILI